MAGTPPAVTVNVIMRMLREAFDGPPGPWTYFIDTSPGAGLLSTLGALSAVEASRQGGPSRSTIAGHVHHVISSLAVTSRLLRGESASRDRSHTWTVSAVDEATWTRLRSDLQREYRSLLVAVGMRGLWDEDALGVALGGIAHTAYHLGAIRQRVPAGGRG